MNALKDDDGKLEQLNCIRCWIGRLRTYRCDVVELSCAGHNGKFGAEYTTRIFVCLFYEFTSSAWSHYLTLFQKPSYFVIRRFNGTYDARKPLCDASQRKCSTIKMRSASVAAPAMAVSENYIRCDRYPKNPVQCAAA